VTDGQTDGHIVHSAYMLSHAKNWYY